MPWQPEPAPAVLVSANTRLIEWVGRLAATVGCGLEVAGPPWAGRSSPDRTPPRLILVGADLDPTQDLSCGVTGAPPGAASARADPPDAAVVVVAQEPVPAQVWQRALAVGARQVAVLPDAQAWLLECLAEAAEPATRRCPVLGVIGGRGGAGASVLAAAAARAASGLGARTLLIDADPLGGGVDLLLGAEDEPGARWPDLATARGWIQPGPLLAGLPKADGLSFLSWARDAGEVPVEAMAAVLSGARYGCDLVVADLARGLPAGTGVVARACTRIILVSPAEVRAAAAARSVQAGVEDLAADLRLVVRGPAPSGLSAETIADALSLPLAGELKPEPGLAAATDRGEPPGLRPRGPLSVLARRLVADLVTGTPPR